MSGAFPTLFLMFAYFGDGAHITSEEPFFDKGECTAFAEKMVQKDQAANDPPKIKFTTCIPFQMPRPDRCYAPPLPPGGPLIPHPLPLYRK